jgi:hypothetical protein
MPMWRCPHCGTPQAETARCWVCRRSSTSCATCRHYRRSVAGQLGYCGLDARRQPLSGDEIRGCWEGWPAGSASRTAPQTIPQALAADSDRRPLAFVEVSATHASERGEKTEMPITSPLPPVDRAQPGSEPRWDLWGDAEPLTQDG